MIGSRPPQAAAFFACAVVSLAAPLTAGAVTLVYSNDVMGEIEPCGCRKNPQGGLVRKEELLRQLIQKDPDVLQLDAGNLFFASEELPEILAKQAAVQADYLVRGLNLLKHDAIVPGPKDFALGLKGFKRIRGKAKFDFLAANLLDPKGKRLLEPRKIYERKDQNGRKLRIGVFGVVGDKLSWNHGLKATDPIAAAREQVKALKRSKVDLVIAVTHQGLDADKELATKVKGIDILLGAHSQSFLQHPEKAGTATIYQASFRNQYIGILPLAVPFDGKDHELLALDEAYETQNESELKKLVAEFKAEVAKINTVESEKLMTLAQAQANKQQIAKFQTFPRCAECHSQQFDFWRKTAHGNALESLLKAGQIRNNECLGCHTLGLGDKQGFSALDQMGERSDLDAPASGAPARGPFLGPEAMAAFLKSLHSAKSMEEKIKISEGDKQSEPVGQVISRIRRSWAPVQCENCHGPGVDHPFSSGYSKAVDVTTVCVQCHTPARAPGWYDKTGKLDLKIAEAKKKSIACPSDEMSE